MGLLDSFEDDNRAALDDLVRRPPAAKPQAAKFSAWSMLTAAPRGIGAGSNETAGGVADVLGAFGQVMGATDARPSMFSAQTQEQRKQEEQARRKMLDKGLEFDAGDQFRSVAREWMPDATTAHTAERTVFDLFRFGTKAVTSTALAGPVAAPWLVGLDEALTTADDLKRQGVDAETRMKVGAVSGVTAGLGVALPAAGRNAVQTAALVAVGGPGSFIAQQAATRQILQDADYTKLADQIDPLDPVGLAVSTLVPAGFGVWAMRGARGRAAEVKPGDVDPEVRPDAAPVQDAVQTEPARPRPTPDQVDAARVEMLTQHVEKSTPSGGDDPVAWRAHDQAFSRAMDQLAQGERVHVSDVSPVIRMQSLEDFVKTSGIKAERLPPSVDGSFLAWLRDRGGVDFAAKRDITGEGGGITANPGGIFRNGGMGLDELARMAEADGYLMPGSIDSGMDNGGTRALADLIQRATSGERVLTVVEQMQKAQRDSVEQAMQERLGAVEQRLRAAGIDPSPARGNVAALEAYEQANRLRIFAAAIDEARGKVEDDQLGGEYDAMARQADQIAQDISDSARTVSQYEAEVTPLSAVMRKMVQRAMDQMASGERVEVSDVAPVPRVTPTDTTEFKAWFGDSKVVDEQGKPLVVYHGTSADVQAFDPGQLQAEGIHLTTDPSVANRYAASRAMDGGRGANVAPLYVKADRVFDVPMITTDAIKEAAAKGFDAVRRGDHIVVMRPDQIKSAIGNSGKFDPNSPSLTDSRFSTWADQINAAIADIRAAAKEAANVQDAPQARADAPATDARQPEPAAQPQAADARSAAPAGAAEQGGGVSRAGGAAPEAAAVAARLADVSQQFPDLAVQMDGMDAPMRLSDFLDQVRREAMDGTDMDIGGNDAPLMQVAANCFLLNG